MGVPGIREFIVDSGIINDTITQWLRSKTLCGVCGEIPRESASTTSVKSAITFSESLENPGPVTAFTKRLGSETRESTFRILVARRRRTRFDRSFWQLNDLRVMMGKEVDRYTYRVTWSEEDAEYVGLCAELPSLSWLDKSPEKALLGIRRLVKDAVADLKHNKEPVPEPISSRSYSGKFMVRVPPEVHRMLAIKAAESGVSINRLVSSKLS